eukprot:2839912-Pleurochrysis_carterae.AAC.2
MSRCLLPSTVSLPAVDSKTPPTRSFRQQYIQLDPEFTLHAPPHAPHRAPCCLRLRVLPVGRTFLPRPRLYLKPRLVP